MQQNSYRWMAIVFSTLVLVSLACAALTGGGNGEAPAEVTRAVETLPVRVTLSPAEVTEPVQPVDEPTLPPAPTTGEYDTLFPLPSDVQNFMQLDAVNDSINFQTSLSLEEVMEFYRQAFTAQGLVERTLLTTFVEGQVFSMVFDGSSNGKALVIQGVAAMGLTNVNIRYE